MTLIGGGPSLGMPADATSSLSSGYVGSIVGGTTPDTPSPVKDYAVASAPPAGYQAAQGASTVTAGGAAQVPAGVDQAKVAAVLQAANQAVQALTALQSAHPELFAQQAAATASAASTTAGGAATAGVSQTPAQSGRGAQDGPGVFREILTKEELEKNPKLKGKLDPPTGGKVPKGVEVKTRADGTRVMTINIHAGAPAGKSTGSGQDIDALRDVARYVNAVNPDVVMVQELKGDKKAIPEMPSVLAHLIGASDMAFTPAKGNVKKSERSGTATFTRNGYTIDKAVNVDLPSEGDTSQRSAGVLAIRPPGGEAFTVVNAHLSHRPSVAASKRRKKQLDLLANIVKSIESTGSFAYTPAGASDAATATGFNQSKIVLGGDLNTTRNGRNGTIDAADAILGTANLTHTDELDEDDSVKTHIDHIYAHGFDATWIAQYEIARNELAKGDPTDHPTYIADIV